MILTSASPETCYYLPTRLTTMRLADPLTTTRRAGAELAQEGTDKERQVDRER